VSVDFAKLQQIFHSTIEQHRPESWEAYLNEACAGDDELRNQVKLLLKAHVEAGSVPGAAANGQDQTHSYQYPAEGTGTTIGPYKLIEEIGEGGMGTVWMAQQIEPVKRLVALKVIKAGMDSRPVIARFEAERQALALMDHPNIAKVLDGGTTSTGRPYFVMDLVKGMPITKFCDSQHLTPRQRLELFIPICQAVQHAHQKGIIHRDLKPSNVLVALCEGKPVPKVIDFGVAKAAGQSLTDKTLVTGFGGIVGTLEYMSPEQADASQLDIDTRSDIYSLGVLLYELLAGSPPFSRKDLQSAGMVEMLRVIREQEPSKPSTKLSTAAGLPSLAASRGTEPEKLTKQLRGELDWIVMKSLEKDRNRRYETANGFAVDVQRYLADEPVTAGPPSAAYRFRKFARRNRVVLCAMGIVAVTLVAGTVVSVWQAVRATRAEGLADARLNAEVRARHDADSNFQTAQKAVDDYFTVVAGSSHLDAPGMEPLRKQLLETAMRYNLEFVRQRSDDPKLQADVAAAHIRVAEITYLVGGRFYQWFPHLRDGVDMITQMIADGRDTPEVRQRLARIRLFLGPALPATDQTPDNEAVFRCLRQQARNWEKLARDDPKVDEFQDGLAAVSLYLASGIFYGSEAVSRGDRAVDIFEKLSSEHPEVPSYRMNLARAYELRGNMMRQASTEKRNETYEKALLLRRNLARESPDNASHIAWLAASYRTLGEALNAQNQPQQAEKTLRQALGLQEKLVADFPAAPTHQDELTRTQITLAAVLKKLDRSPEAQAVYRQALAGLERLVVAFPRAARYQNKLLQTARDLNQLLEASGQPKKKSEVFDAVFAVYDKLTAQSANTSEDLQATAVIYQNLATLLRDSGQPLEAEKAYRKSLDLLRKRAAEFANLPGDRRDLARALGQLADQLRNSNRHQDAEPICREALALWQKLAADFPRERYGVEAGHTLWQLASILSSTGRRDETEKTLREALLVFERLVADFPLEPYYQLEAAHTCWAQLGPLLAGQSGRLKDAEQVYRRGLAAHEKLVDAFPTRDPEYRRRLASNYEALAKLLEDTARPQEAEEVYRRASNAYSTLLELVPKDPLTHNNLAWLLATCPDSKVWDPKRAVELAKKAVELAPRGGNYWNTLGVSQYRAGEWKAAITALEKSMELGKGGDSIDWIFLAMAHWQAGERDKAREWYDRAVQWMDKNQPKNEELLRFRAEAETLLGLKK
jgi:serine/threonine protein kinase/tetratricopeptide (TPR) repeat protein